MTGITVSARSCCIQETVGGVTSGIGGGVAVQRREREDPATESPDTVMITTGGEGTVEGVSIYMYTVICALTLYCELDTI